MRFFYTRLVCVFYWYSVAVFVLCAVVVVVEKTAGSIVDASTSSSLFQHYASEVQKPRGEYNVVSLDVEIKVENVTLPPSLNISVQPFEIQELSSRGLYSPEGALRNYFQASMTSEYYRIYDSCAAQDFSAFLTTGPGAAERSQVDAVYESLNGSLSNAELTTMLHNSHSWPWVGLLYVAKGINRNYNEQKRFSDRRWYVNRLLSPNWLAVNPLEGGMRCTAFTMMAAQLPLAKAVCDCLGHLTTEQRCSVIDRYAQAVHCHSSFANMVDRAVVCPVLSQPDLGLPLSSGCSHYFASNITAPKLNLVDARGITGSVPHTIGQETYRQELATYYVLSKLLERLTRWADYHLFCFKDHQQYANSAHTDFEFLPGWEAKQYFFIEEAGHSTLPIAVLGHTSSQADQRRPGDLTPESQWLLLVRDVRTTFDGYIQMLMRATFPLSGEYPGSVHEGYSAIAESMGINQLVSAIQQNAVAIESGDIHFTVVGAGNFGAGVGILVLRKLIYWLTPNEIANPKLPNGVRIHYNFVAFGGGPVGDLKFTEDISSRVNIRNIVSDREGMESMPCAESYACNTQTTKFNTGGKGELIGTYVPLRGTVRVGFMSLQLFFPSLTTLFT